MHISPDDEPDVGTAENHSVGWFRFHFDDELWEWSPEVQALHGYQPGTVTPTTELVLAHKHPEDREHIAAMLREIQHRHQAFSTRHRIIDTAGDTHHVLVVADRITDESGAVVGTSGFYVDVTPTGDQEQLSAAIAEIAENRAAIEQAKGMLMVVYGIDADTAFDLLRWRSQQANIKLRLLADQIVRDFVGLAQHEHVPTRAAFDNLLLTADRRITRQ